ncbi:hypothetical protein GCM10025783_27180 [Amnibacterium soli]|uniref:DUF4397 domain-containing protein n=1 Tax=Amnibacterium soli TaxID=1282736 RepID=A0ABP8ZCS8_9MICO
MVAPAAPALAAPSSTGWVRVAHLSPDTKSVDVRLVALSGGSKVLRIDDVAYGAVSKYWSLPTGSYAVAMRPAGASPDSTPVVQTSVDVKAGGASTVAVFGRNADLRTRIVRDALTLPKSGAARVRVVQASTASTPVSVTTGGSAIVSDAATTTVSPYKEVRAGRWTLDASRGSDRTTSTIDLKAGQIASVFVLDDAQGGIVLRRVLDSASVGGVPSGFLATGGGYLAHETQQQDDLLLTAGAGGVLVAAAAGTALALRRRTRARA